MSNQRNKGISKTLEVMPLDVKYGNCVGGVVERYTTIEIPGDGIVDLVDRVPCRSTHRHNWTKNG
ncbi:hypothetical protein AB0J85_15905 [Micromonospora echinofusca]|uniref:hypothetical protein n=1 Tax=Micromonospora echinofusca TaxID=47858 RepID=UPI003416ECAC